MEEVEETGVCQCAISCTHSPRHSAMGPSCFHRDRSASVNPAAFKELAAKPSWVCSRVRTISKGLVMIEEATPAMHLHDARTTVTNNTQPPMV